MKSAQNIRHLTAAQPAVKTDQIKACEPVLQAGEAFEDLYFFANLT